MWLTTAFCLRLPETFDFAPTSTINLTLDLTSRRLSHYLCPLLSCEDLQTFQPLTCDTLFLLHSLAPARAVSDPSDKRQGFKATNWPAPVVLS